MTRMLFHGKGGALRLGVAGVKPMADWDEFPPWRRFFSSWMTHAGGPFVPEKLGIFRSGLGFRNAILGANGTWWTKDTRKQFNATLPDEVLERLGAALGLNVSFSRIEVVLTGVALEDTQPDLEPSKDVDAYVLFVEQPSDVAQVRRLFSTHDRTVISHHYHSTKWASRREEADLRCDYDVLRRAFDRTVRANGSLAAVNWWEDEWKVLAKYELRSLKPVIFVVNVSREQYTHQNPAFVAATEKWVRETYPGRRPSPVILTSIELEEELAQRNSSLDNNVVSLFDGILGKAFRYLQLTRFYVLLESSIQARNIPGNTRANDAAGVVFHLPCRTRRYNHGDGFCTTHSYYFNDTARSHLVTVDVGRVKVMLERVPTAVDKRDFTAKSVDYRIQDGDVVRFKIMNERNEALAEPEDHCVGFGDYRPVLLHPIGADLRIGIIGLPNAGKTTLFNLLTGADAAVSPKVFTTRNVMARSRKLADDRFDWLAKQFPKAKLRPSTVTFVDTPALLHPFDCVPWKSDVFEALKGCDIVLLVIRAFNDSTVEHWESPPCDYCDHYSHSDDEDIDEPEHAADDWQHEVSSLAVIGIVRTHDKKVLAKLSRNATDG